MTLPKVANFALYCSYRLELLLVPPEVFVEQRKLARLPSNLLRRRCSGEQALLHLGRGEHGERPVLAREREAVQHELQPAKTAPDAATAASRAKQLIQIMGRVGLKNVKFNVSTGLAHKSSGLGAGFILLKGWLKKGRFRKKKG